MDECSQGSDDCQCDSSLTGCTLACENTIGSYICSCGDGYTLDITDATCIGKYSCHAVSSVAQNVINTDNLL